MKNAISDIERVTRAKAFIDEDKPFAALNEMAAVREPSVVEHYAELYGEMRHACDLKLFDDAKRAFEKDNIVSAAGSLREIRGADKIGGCEEFRNMVFAVQKERRRMRNAELDLERRYKDADPATLAKRRGPRKRKDQPKIS